VDLHAGLIQGFFNCPVDNLYARPVLLKKLSALSGDIVMVSPDAGGVERARSFAKKMDASLAVIDKRRDRPNQVAEMHIVGNVAGKTAVLVDDMIDTAGTICTAANLLMEGGAKEVYACASHAVLSGPALERLNAAPFKEIIVTDTIPLGERVAECEKIRAEYRARAKELRDTMTENAEHEAEEMVSRARSTAAVEKRNILLNAKSEMIDAAFDTALAEIRAWDDAKYRELLVGLVSSAVIGQVKAEEAELADYGADELERADRFEIVLSRHDRDAHGEAVLDGVRKSVVGRLDRERLDTLVLSQSVADIDGGVMIRYGDMEINCSLDMLFARLRESLESEVNKILFNQN
jgi:vacuolar-type H+-ATPase subunit E/Vma4